MQVILTEEEWFKLKHQSDDDKKTYVKRIDVALALKDLEQDLRMSMSGGVPYLSEQSWKRMFERFVKRIN